MTERGREREKKRQSLTPSKWRKHKKSHKLKRKVIKLNEESKNQTQNWTHIKRDNGRNNELGRGMCICNGVG